MISNERLQELIKEGATIWSSYRLNYNVIAVNLTDKKRFVIYTDDMSILDRDTEYTYQLKNLFETRKEAEWHLKYHATRTEELNLPMWNEFITYNENIGVSFVGEDWVVYELSNDIDIYHKPRILLTADGEYFEEWQSTEENYEKACDLCLKLFKGELQ